MKGNNEIVFNNATMNEAVEHYLNSVLFSNGNQVTVTGVSQVTAYEQGFKVDFMPKDKETQ